jgi:hypothetical protein
MREFQQQGAQAANNAARYLTICEMAELRSIERLGECHESTHGLTERLERFGLVLPGTARIGAWKLTPWGKLVATSEATPWGTLAMEAAKEGAQ